MNYGCYRQQIILVQAEIPNEDHNCINYNTHVGLIFASS